MRRSIRTLSGFLIAIALLTGFTQPTQADTSADPGSKPSDPNPGQPNSRDARQARAPSVANSAIRDVAGFSANQLARNDDGSTGSVELPFPVTVFGSTRTALFVNNNGNVSFGAPLSAYTPVKLGSLGLDIIAPFWADVDTRAAGSGITTYGTGQIEGHQAFGVEWFNVGYYNAHDDKLNTFQLVLIDRSDTGAGNIDIEFNYGSITWETGGASGGSGGLGGTSVRVGYAAQSGSPEVELPGSGINGALLDGNASTGLASHSLNSRVAGRYLLSVRSSTILGGLSIGDPQPDDPLLKRSFSVVGAAGSQPIGRFDYGWTQRKSASQPDRISGSLPASSNSGYGWLDYSDTTPGTSWYLFVRAQDVDGLAGDWVRHGSAVRTPDKPILVALGDSVTSGHHTVGQSSSTCDDPSYSYAYDVAIKMRDALPPSWRTPAKTPIGRGGIGYFNFAHSGFSTRQVLGDDASRKNACGERIKGIPVRNAQNELRKRAGSWNRVIMTAGVNDTNWVDVIAWEVANEIAQVHAPCNGILAAWNGNTDSVQTTIASNAQDIALKLMDRTRGDRAARIIWLGYYDIAGTTTFFPASCDPAAEQAVATLESAITRYLPGTVDFVPTNASLGLRADLLQPMLNPFGDPTQFGWPHPINPAGTSALSDLVDVL